MRLSVKAIMNFEPHNELRAYAFTNFYLSSIQHGIQAFHALHEMFVEYKPTKKYDPASEMLYDWATYHKTMITLNGGNLDGLRKVWELVNNFGVDFPMVPFACFHEDMQSLGGIMTCVIIVLPASIYNAQKLEDDSWIYTTDDKMVLTTYAAESSAAKFLTFMKGCKLAS